MRLGPAPQRARLAEPVVDNPSSAELLPVRLGDVETPQAQAPVLDDEATLMPLVSKVLDFQVCSQPVQPCSRCGGHRSW